MADEPKKPATDKAAAPSPPPPPEKKHPLVEIGMMLLFLYILNMLITALLAPFTGATNNFNIFRNGFSGFSLSSLTLKNTRPLASVLNPIGAHVIVSKDTVSVLDTAGGKEIATKIFGAKAHVIGGPQSINDTKYYQVKFDDGTVGWVDEDALAYVPTIRKPLSETTGVKVGTEVAASGSITSVFDKPGGQQIATEQTGKTGVIIGGPVTKDGIKYYLVRFDDGVEGYVAESDLDSVTEAKPDLFTRILIYLWKVFSLGRLILFGIALLLFIGLIYIFVRLTNIRREVHLRVFPPITEVVQKAENKKWLAVLSHSESVNENDWKFAIIEADIILDDLLTNIGYIGDTLAEKLKSVAAGDFATLDIAWEAHKIRNRIAHDGSDFLLTAHETKRVIALYERVFKEFDFI